jgi:hypothetical protein
MNVRLGRRVRATIAGLAVLAAACSPQPAPSVAPGSPARPSAAATAAVASARLVVDIAGTIRCADFPYGCGATLSLLPPGSPHGGGWRPSATDPRWVPDWSKGSPTDHFDPSPVAPLPAVPTGSWDAVVTVLGGYDTASYLADGSRATDLLGTCTLRLEVLPTDQAVHLRVTFVPAVDFQTDCRIDRVEAATSS